MKTTKTIALLVALAAMCTVTNARDGNIISVDWSNTIAGQSITGASQSYTVSVPSTITTIPFTYEIHAWTASGTHSKVAEGTTTQLTKVLSFNGKLLLNRGQSEPVKVMSTSGTVIVEKTLPATLSVYSIQSSTKYFYTDNKLTRVTFTTIPGGTQYSTQVETFTDSLDLMSSVEFVGMKFVGIAGKLVAGNFGTNGKIVSISDSALSKDFTSPITDIVIKKGSVFVLADKLYQLDNQLAELSNKPIQGTALHFITDKAVVFDGTSAVLYDSTFTNLFTLSVNQQQLVEINSTSDGIYLATSNTFTKIILGSSNPNGITDAENENSVTLYPNPTIEQISIEGIAKNSKIEILNIIGERILTTQTTTIDVSSLPAGVYFCRVDGLTKQFIKR